MMLRGPLVSTPIRGLCRESIPPSVEVGVLRAEEFVRESASATGVNWPDGGTGGRESIVGVAVTICAVGTCDAGANLVDGEVSRWSADAAPESATAAGGLIRREETIGPPTTGLVAELFVGSTEGLLV